MAVHKLSDIVEKGLDLSDVESCASYSFISDDDLVRAVTELNERYVFKREDLANKSLDARLASAYLYLYFTTNVPKLFKLLNYLPSELIKRIVQAPWIDFGSGPATYTVAWYAWLSSQGILFPKEALLVEKDPSMMELANKVLDKFLHHENILVTSSFTQKKFIHATLFFGHSCNELTLENLLQVIEEAQPQFVIFLEPGTPDVFKKMLEVRAHLLSRGYRVQFPCLQQKSCPMKQQDDWCHQYLHLRFPSSVERLSQMVSLRRQHSAVLFHVYERNPSQDSNVGEGHFRVVRGPEQNKGAWTWQVCNQEGELLWFESLTRHYSKDQLKKLEMKVPGEVLVSVQIQKEVKPHHYRVLISQL